MSAVSLQPKRCSFLTPTRPIDICATYPQRLIKGTLSFLALG